MAFTVVSRVSRRILCARCKWYRIYNSFRTVLSSAQKVIIFVQGFAVRLLALLVQAAAVVPIQGQRAVTVDHQFAAARRLGRQPAPFRFQLNFVSSLNRFRFVPGMRLARLHLFAARSLIGRFSVRFRRQLFYRIRRLLCRFRIHTTVSERDRQL